MKQDILQLPLPDLRFEQSFMNTLKNYASLSSQIESNAIDLTPNSSAANEANLQPLAPITPGIVIYAIIKDQIIMPFLQGLIWSGTLMMMRPVLFKLIQNGRDCGIRVFNGLGLNRSYKSRPI